jgi:hypothetical protein
LLYYLALEVNNSVIVSADLWRQIASWGALLGISIIDSIGESKTATGLPERFREKLRRLLADVLAHEEAVDLISRDISKAMRSCLLTRENISRRHAKAHENSLLASTGLPLRRAKNRST